MQHVRERGVRALFSKKARVLIAALMALTALSGLAQRSSAQSTPPDLPVFQRTSIRPPDEQELFGMVARDPFYEYNTDPVNFPNQPNKIALEQQVSQMAMAGVRWLRMEFFADYDGSVQAGDINWSKYDWFIKELAPKYGIKVLALLNVGMVAYDGATVHTAAFNDPPDGAGGDPGDGTNHFIRVFVGRAEAIASRYGSNIGAYEIINEPNISYDLWLDSGHKGAEISPERYSNLLYNTYKGIKSIQPQADVLVGGLLIGSPPEGQNHDQFDYLYQLYMSQWVQRYKSQGGPSHAGWNVVPWDGVALHPYYLELTKLYAILREFTQKLRDRGDAKSKLWVTEVGAPADPPTTPGEAPTQHEIDQAYYLRNLYTGILNDSYLKANVPHVFWFKYEDFVPGNYTDNYGVVRLLETPDGKNYSPSGQVYVHKLAYQAYQEVALGYNLTDRLEQTLALEQDPNYFPETGQAIAPEFMQYWQLNGGTERFGYPISRPIVLRGYLSQFFQRAVFEYHPENQPPNDVLLRLLGDEFTQGRNFPPADPSSVPPDRIYMPATGHTLGGAFLKFWQDNGGLAVFGYPISEEITEVSPTDGQTYTVQYFERNRFEYHPENAGTKYEVELGLLGANLIKTNPWWR